MLFAGLALARRVEAAEAANARGCARAGAPGLEIAGGCAVFMGEDSPLTQAVGLGLNGPVRDAELDALEAFFRSRGAPLRVDLCPLADPGLLEMLTARGCRPTEFNNVLVRQITAAEEWSAPRVRPMAQGEAEVWADLAGRGFFEKPELCRAELEIGLDITAMAGVECYFAAEGGELVASGAMAAHGGLAVLFADSSLVACRRRGLQRELIAARLSSAFAMGCDMANASTLPGSGSQRNYERLGFQVAYTKATMTAL